MTTAQISEVLYFVQSIEKLLDTKGAVGESYSDKVKSFNKLREPVRPTPIQKPAIASLGHKFYRDRDDGDYYYKEQYEYESNIDNELNAYIAYKDAQENLNDEFDNFNTQKDKYYRDRAQLIGGHYNNLIRIAHERNQLLHIHNYKIPEFRKFKRACRDVISYLEGTKWLSKPVVNLKAKQEILIDQHRLPLHLKLKDKCLLVIIEEYISLIIMLLIANLGAVFWMKLDGHTTEIVLSHSYSFVILLNIFLTLSYFGLFQKLFRAIILLLKSLTRLILWLLTPLFIVIFLISQVLMFVVNVILYILAHIVEILVVVIIIYFASQYFSNIKTKESSQVHKYEAVKTADKSTCNYYKITSNGLNIRSDHQSKAHSVATLHKGDSVCVTKKFGNWLYVDKKGWIYEKYTKKSSR
ncbi:SH3 domain-containing protein [Sulfurimonas sp. SAG-AH-194-C20]|nr:SH3 domain-containing protein [Sulfurimonas sp. SAG-AH-194-C20]MDF1878142.1 SH3 domain-containing protein [Sulfurimonas sp. SAG-AH-194-C20]